ncbi:lanthionine synthetase C family protein [Actinocrispum sp. NPDC049592]|uniref:lanthionine synthetase C family protein n=1 Tax=Actinocrispum sp. NPDC049592 TaxID=3154835 RepID=UPI003428105E
MIHPDPSLLDLASDIAAGLDDPATTLTSDASRHQSRPQSLANGAAGVALLHIERALAQPDRWGTAHAWLSAATSVDLHAGPGASLFFGVPALAFVTHTAAGDTGRYQRALTQLDVATERLTRARLAAAHARIDRGDLPALAEFDLIRGLTGLGVHHLRRAPRAEVTSAVLAYLVRLTEPLPGLGDELPGWWTEHGPTGQPPADYPGGHGNFGMAHGITGPLALLALALRRGVVVDGHRQAIARIFAWLDAWQHDHPVGPWWPRTITLAEARAGHCDQPGPLQPSWCYGTPGIARAQQLAAIATGDTARRRTAERALLGCVNDPGQLARIIDPSLCHGAAGLLHTVWRAAGDAATGEVSACLPHLARLLVERLQTASRSVGLLEGSTSAALALHTAATGTAPPSGWDSCMLLA